MSLWRPFEEAAVALTNPVVKSESASPEPTQASPAHAADQAISHQFYPYSKQTHGYAPSGPQVSSTYNHGLNFQEIASLSSSDVGPTKNSVADDSVVKTESVLPNLAQGSPVYGHNQIPYHEWYPYCHQTYRYAPSEPQISPTQNYGLNFQENATSSSSDVGPRKDSVADDSMVKTESLLPNLAQGCPVYGHNQIPHHECYPYYHEIYGYAPSEPQISPPQNYRPDFQEIAKLSLSSSSDAGLMKDSASKDPTVKTESALPNLSQGSSFYGCNQAPHHECYPYCHETYGYAPRKLQISPTQNNGLNPKNAAFSPPSSSDTVSTKDSLSEDPAFLAFEQNALQTMAAQRGGTLLTDNPRMRRTVRSSSNSDSESYRASREKNNAAAKQSRDRRKMREIRMALKVMYFQRETARLRGLLVWPFCQRCHHSIGDSDSR